MNQDLESLRQRIASQHTTVTFGGETWRIGKLMAADAIKIARLMDGAAGVESDNDARLVPYYAALLSKTLQDDAGGLPYDSDEGRALLEKIDVLIDLGLAATEFNTSKKK